jgi:hypothetical protein
MSILKPLTAMKIYFTRLIVCSAVLFALLMLSCRKEIKELEPAQTKTSKPQKGRSLRDGVLSGFNELLELAAVSDEIKSNIDTSDYFFYDPTTTQKIWVFALRRWTNGVENSKAVVVSNEEGVNISYISYEYERGVYNSYDFNTYSGTTSFYNASLERTVDVTFREGIAVTSVPEVVGMVIPYDPNHEPTSDPGGYIDMCALSRVFCPFSGAPTGGGPSLTTLLMQCPPNIDGGGGAYITVAQYLSGKLGLDAHESNFLVQNKERADEIYRYLQTPSKELSSENKQDIVRKHITRMIDDTKYKNFVVNHGNSTNNITIWWEDKPWLKNSSNFTFDADDASSAATDLNDQELALTALFPLQAVTLYFNRDVAFNMSDTRFGPRPTPNPQHLGLNDKKDAFRHAFFQGINVRDCSGQPVFFTYNSPSQIVKLFADAHESDSPPQLDLEKQMDTHNNDKGILYAISLTSSPSDISVANDIMILLTSGDLIYLKPLNHNDPYWYVGSDGTKKTATDGITSSTVKTPTNQ